MSDFRARTKQGPKLHNVKLVAGVSGPSVYVNDLRIAGPWNGSGDLVGEWWVTDENLRLALASDGSAETIERRKREAAKKTANRRRRAA
jgi:hypothetical protein